MSPHIDFRAVAQKSLAAYPTSNVYILLDHGGLPGLHRQLLSSSVKWVSLFDCTKEANALAVAPILILAGSDGHLQMSRFLFEWIGKNGTYTSTVLMLLSPLQIETIKHRLAVRLDVSISENMEAMLRYFDPRIFEGLMKVLTVEQATTFLSPAEKWLYANRAGNLVNIDATFNTIDEPEVPLTLTAKQEFDLIDMSESDQVLASLRESTPDLMLKLPLPIQYDFVAMNIRAARAAGLTSIPNLVLYNVVALVKGQDFMKGQIWSRLMDDVKRKTVEFPEAALSLDIDEAWRAP
jgi:hypothetical protein